MAYKTSYELHHNFPKIADEAGFTFNTHRPRVRIDWNKIKLIDTNNLVRERKFILIEQHLNDILDCIFESEFDVRILDEGVLKIFRLAQLTVEYQQFCRHYLDRSVYVLREEINSLAQELDVTKKELSEKTEEIKKLKRKTKHSYRTSLPYGNDNIASMILKTLTNKTDYFPTSTTGDSVQYNKCSYCDKVFMNQLYLKSHISRRHSHVMEIPQKDNGEVDQKDNTENNLLRNEVSQLKDKLGEMEEILKNVNMHDNTIVKNNDNINEANKTQQPNASSGKLMKDAEVSANNEINVLDKIEEWKKEEQEKYNKEINLLRHQIMETIQTIKEKESTTNSAKSESNTIEQLNKTISQQGEVILSLKQELVDSQLRMEKEEDLRRKENEAQMTHFLKRAESHAKQYESLLQKLNDVAKEAKESRTQAEAEKERVAQLETLLQKSLNEKSNKDDNKERSHIKEHKPKELVKKSPATEKSYASSQIESNRQTLEQLHQKAQALLNIGSSTSSSSDTSSVEQDVNTASKHTNLNPKIKHNRMQNHKNAQNRDELDTPQIKSKETAIQSVKKNGVPHQHKIKQKPIRTPKNSHTVQKSTKIQKNGSIISGLTPGSPMKIVRAKIMEEVNNRLITAGVDPLNSGLPKTKFQKQRTLLQQQDELKAKRNPSYEKVKHSILAYLDSKLPQNVAHTSKDYVSPSKISKTFNLTSVISNVKNKALSLVKSNDVNVKDKRKLLSADVAKRAMSLLNTPPDSNHSSPVNVKRKGNEIQSTNKEQQQNTPKRSITNADIEKINIQPMKPSRKEIISDGESNTSSQSDHKYIRATVQQTSKSLEKLIKSPARRPLSANSEYSKSPHRDPNNDNHLLRSQSATNISHVNEERDFKHKEVKPEDTSSESSEHIPVEEPVSKETVNNSKQTKGVLKNASSTSSLNKKKVLFDMDAIQMKSLSASPSQSITEKSDGNEKYELGLINLDGEEWDISSIENEPLNNDANLKISTRASPKIAELKQTIEAQLARRNDTPSTAIVGGVDILAGPMLRASSVAGSNTSLGSSILDDSESLPPVINHKAFVKPKIVAHKDDSEIDLSEFSTDGIATNKHDDTF